MNILKSKVQRIFFIIAIFGALIFTIRTIIWLNISGHNIYNITKDIPNALMSGSSQSRLSLIENHIACKWNAKKPTTDDAKVMAEDTFYALSKSCSKNLPRVNDASDLILKISGYELALSGEPYIEFVNYSTGEITTTGKTVKDQYFDHVDLFSFSSITKDKAAECLVTAPLWCIEKSRSTRINARDIFLSDFYFKIGIWITALGLAGSFFAFAFIGLWKQTLGKILNWVKSGN